jgi:hypothetical protein
MSAVPSGQSLTGEQRPGLHGLQGGLVRVPPFGDQQGARRPGRSKKYAFASWSDGGAQVHTVVAPVAATTYTARFR